MDFNIGLANFEGKNVIMVVKRLINYAHFFSLSHPFKEIIIIATFNMEKTHKLHGNPNTIVDDKDPILNGNFQTKLFSCIGIQLAHISYYNPQYGS
jgi:hypothetical protein